MGRSLRPVSQMMELEHRERKWVAEGDTPTVATTQRQRPVLLIPNPELFSLSPCSQCLPPWLGKSYSLACRTLVSSRHQNVNGRRNHRLGYCGCTISREPMNVNISHINQMKTIPTLNFHMIHVLVSFPAKNVMSYSFRNVYRGELEPVGGEQRDYCNHPKWVPRFLLCKHIFLSSLWYGPDHSNSKRS